MADVTIVTLFAPCSGWLVPLAEIDDPVFAEGMMGDGLAIEPLEGEICAPCDGEIIQLHRAGHAVTIRAGNGAEILIHIGLETVALNGVGFTPKVAVGQKIAAGDVLIAFDLAAVARGAKDLITPIIITNAEHYAVELRPLQRAVDRTDTILTLRQQGGPVSAITPIDVELRRDLVIRLAHGLHARPAAKISALAKSFSADIALLCGDRRANGRSAVSLLGLGLSFGAHVTLVAAGSDAEAALAALAELIESGIGESHRQQAAPVTVKPARAGELAGVRAAPGLALGPAFRLSLVEISVAEQGHGIDVERRSLDTALRQVAAALTASTDEVMAAHLAFLEDPDLSQAAFALIDQGKTAGFAWRTAIAAQIDILAQSRDARFVERIADLRDIERQVLLAAGGHADRNVAVPDGAILLAEDLLPSQLVALDGVRLGGIITKFGGPTSHLAILAAARSIPAVVAVGAALDDIADGTLLLLDADDGVAVIAPSAETVAATETRIRERARQREAAIQSAQDLCVTADGVRIEIAANLGSVAEAAPAVAAGAEGCGLLRSEFLFLDRDAPPHLAEQTAIYRAIADALRGRPLIIRTLDIGGDKPASYLPIPREENPALGLRGIRVSLWRPDLLETQLRAILAGVPEKQCRIMLPMVASLSELRQVRSLLERLRQEMAVGPVQLGIMVETPAAAITADLLAAEADFLSIGTNDLTQYCLAMDRGNAAIAAGVDALHPAVLRLIHETAKGAARHGRWTGVCGGLASDLAAAPVLIGLGIQELSATTSRIADLKALVRRLTLPFCRDLAARALTCTSAAEVRALIATEMR